MQSLKQFIVAYSKSPTVDELSVITTDLLSLEG